MATVSNLYAERIFSEHPVALWPLDDNISYVQLLSGARQNLSNATHWNDTNLTVQNPSSYSDTPISNSDSSRFILSSSASYSSLIESSFTLNSSTDFSQDKTTACFSGFVYLTSIFIHAIEIGISYGGNDLVTRYEFEPESAVGWHKIQHTFDLPDNENITFFIRTEYAETGSISDFITQFNGISLGQWSEQFNSVSTGFNDISIPAEIEHFVTGGSNYTCTVLDSYGIDSGLNGYYIIGNKEVYAQNSGIPMVFGSNHTTRVLTATDNNPSIVFPGCGFLNEAGKYNQYTFEAWLRLDNVSVDPVRIVGPVFSTDGIYVEEGFISIRIGPYAKSYFVGKWYRPMLVHFKYSEIEASLLINGEQVITMPIDLNNIDFPAQEDLSANNQDWIGIYGSPYINPLEIDCISITPYQIPLEMAKRRFVYGQGVPNVDLSNDTFLTNSTVFDYSFANYSSNALYPDVNPWRNGFSNNLDTTSSYMTTPAYDLPEVQLKQGSRILSVFDWYYENKTANDTEPDEYTYIRMKPLYERENSLTWTDVYDIGIGQWDSLSASTWYEASHEFYVNTNILYSDVTIYYPNVNVLTDRLSSVVGVFESPPSGIINQTLLLFRNKSTGETINVELDINWLKYIYTDSNGNETLLKANYIEDSTRFIAGFNLKEIQDSEYATIGNFFAVLDNISLNIGGYFSNSFGGKIYAIHFNNDFFYQKDLSTYFTNGFANQITGGIASYSELIKYTANYSLLPSMQSTIVNLDIGVTGYWEDIQPLSYFGKYVTDKDGEQYYDLDMLQFNIDIPRRGESDGIFTMTELSQLYGSYGDMTDAYNSYVSLQVGGEQDLIDIRTDSSVNSYLSFQRYYEAGKKPYSDFINTASVPYNNVIEFDSSEYLTTKYEIVDNMVIFPPKNPDFKDYYIGVHLEITVRGINNRNLLLRRMELASLAFDNSSPYEVGTKYSLPVYPFSRTSYLFNYKQKNPFTIYKDSSPYLYLTEYSGIYVNPYSTSNERGVLVPINKDKQNAYSVGGLQFWSRYPLKNFPSSPFKIMKIKSETTDIDIYLQPEIGGQRAFLKAYDYLTGKQVDNFIFFQDGSIVDSPVIYPRQWSAINISFLSPVNFDNVTGRLELYAGIVFNNIGEYNYAQELFELAKSEYKKWFQVYSDVATSETNTWADILQPVGEISEQTWQDAMLTLVQNEYTINGEQQYNSQVGLSVSVTEDISSLSVYSNGADVFTDVVWQTFEASPI